MKKQFKIPALALALLLNGFQTKSQSCLPSIGPGGIRSSIISNSLWFDASSLGLANNAAVASWTDLSGGNYHATQSTTANKPTYLTNQLNGWPVVSFDGTNDYLSTGAVSALNTDELTWFIVGKSNNNTANGQMIGSSYTSGAGSTYSGHLWKTMMSSGPGNYVSYVRDASGGATGINSTYDTNYHLITDVMDGTSDVNEVFTDGTSSGIATGVDCSPSGHIRLRMGVSATLPLQYWFNGKIAEAIVYPVTLNTAQQVIVENYLATKYNLTMTGLDIYSYESTNSYEAAGIGRTGLGNFGKVSTARSNIVEIMDLHLNDEDYMMWAHDNAPTASSSSNIPASYVSTSGSRMQRTWRADKTASYSTGFNESYSFYLAGIIPGTPSNIEMLIDADGDFSSGSTSITTGYSYDNTCSIATWTTTIPDGYYFTIGSPDGTSAFSRMAENITINEDAINASNFSVYPNPTNGEFNVTTNSLSENTSVEITNAFGQIVLIKTLTEDNTTLHLEDQAAGIYFIKIMEQGKVSAYKKIVKQ